MFDFIKANKDYVAVAITGAIILFLIWFVPPVWQLHNGARTVTQWHKQKGEVEVEVGPNSPNWIKVEAISKNVLHAFVTSEDDEFYTHHGISVQFIKHAFLLNLRKRRYVSGASTITQQVVKMAFLSRKKSIVRKLREIVGAVLLDAIMSKEKILEWYINLAEFGDSVYGIKAASWHYFKTKPELLTIQQATHLAIVLPSPNGWSFGLRRRSLTPFGHSRFLTIITRMKRNGYITEELWLNALATGDFGKPIDGYNKVLAALAKSQPAETAISVPETDVGLEMPEEAEENLPQGNQSTEATNTAVFDPNATPLPVEVDGEDTHPSPPIETPVETPQETPTLSPSPEDGSPVEEVF